ncbi:Alpha/Beta hydrolase protein [Aspergillus tetrazonus]
MAAKTGLSLIAWAIAAGASLAWCAEVPAQRSYLYVGGQYTQDSAGQHVFTNQIYVEKLTPTTGVTKSYPIVFIHGQAQTGTNWLNKPDGGEGWVSYFLSQGYACYIIDQTFRGRSPWFPGNGSLSTYSAELLQQRFTAPQHYNLWPQASLHTQWNGTGVMGDPIFDTYYASTVEFLDSATYQQSTVQAAGAALLDLIGSPVAVFSNASARPYGLTDIPLTFSPPVTDPANDLVKKIIPSNSSLYSDCVVQASSPLPRQLVNLAQVPVLVVTTESSYHASYDWCTVQFLQQAGVPAKHLKLADIGIHGNGHMVFMEKNSLQVAAILGRWIERT